MSELIEYAALEGAFSRYFAENTETFQMLFGSFDGQKGIAEFRVIVFPERMYDQFPAVFIFLNANNERVFEENLQESVNAAMKRLSYLPNIVDYEDVDPEAFEVEYSDGRIVSLFVVVRDLIKKFLEPLVPNTQNVRTTIGLHDEEPTLIA